MERTRRLGARGVGGADAMTDSANDNPEPIKTPVTVGELAAMLQIDEDTLLARIAAVISKRPDSASPDEPASGERT